MGEFAVERSILITRPREEVYALLKDFRQWPIWSPWLIAEPDAELVFHEDGSGYSWRGEVVGQGGLQVVKENAPYDFELSLHIVKPWKSRSQVFFECRSEGDWTRVRWHMKSKLPFYMMLMKHRFVAEIGRDYRRGLGLLKDLAENGMVSCQIRMERPLQIQKIVYVGVKTVCRISDVTEKKEADLQRAKEWLKVQHLEIMGPPLAIFHQWSLATGDTCYSVGFPVAKQPGWLPDDMATGVIPELEVQPIIHHGFYRHLCNAWAVGEMYVKAKKINLDKAFDRFEIYDEGVADNANEPIQTTVYFPIKR